LAHRRLKDRYTGVMATDSPAGAMRAAAAAFVDLLDDEHRARALYPFEDDEARRWIEYRPRPRPGTSLASIEPAARKAAHRLLATGLSPSAYAQAVMVTALEEVLDRQEGWRRGRHSGDYWVAVFGDPSSEDRWGWRFEGHHLSVTMTVTGDVVSPAPVFFGANPARVTQRGQTVVRPLAPEEDLALELLDRIGPDGRRQAIVPEQAPDDILSATHARAGESLEPLGMPASALRVEGRELLDDLVRLYLDRLPRQLAESEARRLAGSPHELHFCWAGSATPFSRHYYRIQGDDLLIEYDNTQDDGNHAHTVLRRPRSDFGDDVLAAHRAEA
jgi:Protein of unknown function (DUF3500)